ncbi:hypothetical protein EBB07_29105 [Paenibacillaceae bacterium]|nr:hypothetical protein EBB07_29105 [Paenibacillaceae bacterium]
MLIYETNSTFPIKNPTPGQTYITTLLAVNSFDICAHIKDPTPSEIRVFKENDLFFNIYFEKDIPFISIAYSNSPWTYDCTINLAIENVETREAFLQQGNIVNLLLIDAQTNLLIAIRTLGMYQDGMSAIKEACKNQLVKEGFEVKRDADIILNVNSTQDLIRKSQIKYRFRK